MCPPFKAKCKKGKERRRYNREVSKCGRCGLAGECILYIYGWKVLNPFCSRLSHLTRSLSRIVCKGQERPKGSKDTLRPDFHANTRSRIFCKKPKSPQDTGMRL
jgi:hypothetical protein